MGDEPTLFNEKRRSKAKNCIWSKLSTNYLCESSVNIVCCFIQAPFEYAADTIGIQYKAVWKSYQKVEDLFAKKDNDVLLRNIR